MPRARYIFTNLLNNAAKYAEKGGHIWLTARPTGHRVSVSVRDTGIGIASEHLCGYFRDVLAGHAGSRTLTWRFGHRSALVRGLVEPHGGTIEAHSDGPGQGSEFIVHLPTAEGPAEQPIAKQSPETATTLPSASTSRILVVDDNPDTTATLAKILEGMGHHVHMVHNGLEAVHAAAGVSSGHRATRHRLAEAERL